jgi:lipopolysaccharide transport system ATP-binding protein
LHAEGPAPEIVQAYQEDAIKTSAPNGILPLADLADHGTKEGITLTHLRLLTADGQQAVKFSTGQDVKVAVGYRSDGRQRLSKVSVGITVSGHARVAIFHCENTCVGRPFEQLPASGEFVCSINRLPLTPGRYSLGASCSADGEVVHGVPHAGPFNVVDGAFYETGNLPPVGAGNALIDYTWALHEGAQVEAAGDADVS